MFKAAEVSRSKFRQLVEALYTKCAKCAQEKDEELFVLPCIHVVCQNCLRSAIQRAQERTTLPPKLKPTKYQDPRRFECPVCCWPQYVPYGKDGQIAYPSKLPLHEHLLAVGDCPPKEIPLDTLEDSRTKPTDPSSYETRQGNYIYESNIGSFGPHYQNGQMMRVSGLAVDESHPGRPLVVVCESKANVLLSFHLFGKLEQARRVRVQIRDICIGENGTIIATVAEQNYALAKWDSALTISGVRHENLFRDIYGHGAQINSEPFGVTRDSQGRFMVTMLAKDRVCRWDEWKSGDHIYWFGDTGQKGTGLMGPYYVAKLSNERTVVCSTNDHKVKIIDDEGNRLVKEIGGLGSDLPDLCFPHGLCVDTDDNIYIADTGNFRVVVYDRNGAFLSCVVNETWNYGSDVKPTHVAMLQDGRLVVVMQGREYCKVHVYLPRSETTSDGEECACTWNWSKCWSGCGCMTRDVYESLN